MPGKLKSFGYMKSHNGLETMTMEGKIPGSSSRDRPLHRWTQDIKQDTQSTTMDIAEKLAQIESQSN